MESRGPFSALRIRKEKDYAIISKGSWKTSHFFNALGQSHVHTPLLWLTETSVKWLLM